MGPGGGERVTATKPTLSSRDIRALIRAAPTGSPEYRRLNLAYVRAGIREAREAHAERERRAASRPPPSAEVQRVVENERAHWEAYEAGNRAAEDDETELRRAWAPAELRELKGSEHGNERVTPVTPNDGDAP
jgi:hypothetical protein